MFVECGLLVLLTELQGKLELQPHQARVMAQARLPQRQLGIPRAEPDAWCREGAPRGMLMECKLDGEWIKSVIFEKTLLDGGVGKEDSVQSLGA